MWAGSPGGGAIAGGASAPLGDLGVAVLVAGVGQRGGVGAAAQADLDVAGGEAQLADAVDQVLADRVGRLLVVGGVQPAGEAAVDGVGEQGERDVEVDRERNLGAERVQVQGADLLGELVLDPPALSVAFDQLLGGRLPLVGEQERCLVTAETVDGELAERAAFDRDRIFVVGGGLVLAGAVKAGFGPGTGRERLERGALFRAGAR
jgi:hypothetical protein